MKKAIAIILLAVLCCFVFAACNEVPDRIDPVENDTSRFQYIGSDTVTQNGNGEAGDIIQYYVDNETSIVYVVMVNHAGNGTWATGLTPLIDTDGGYVKYSEFKKQ